MKLLIVTQVVDRNDDVLGAFHQWIVRFAEVFESVEVICLRLGEHALPPNVRVHSLGKESKPSRWRYVWRFYRYALGLRSRYDAVFVHMNPEYVALAGPLWRLMGKRVFLWYAHKKGSFLRTIALALVDRVLSVSKESFVDHRSKKFVAVGHGVDPDMYACPSAARADKNVILSVGRLSPVKEYDTLVEAARTLREMRGRTDFLIRLIGASANAGDDAYVAKLKEKIAAYGLTDAFDFFGSVPNRLILPHLCSASVFVSMQKIGGAGKSFLEAMSCGVPTVVCTPVFNELLGTWKDTLYYDGSPEAFAACLNACLSLTDARREELSTKLRGIVVEHHNLKNLVRRVKAEYESLRIRR